MLFKSLLRILKSYRFSLIKIIFFEIIYLSRGFKGNKFTFSKDDTMADNIPCPYYFLYKIKNFLIDKNIKSFVDLGCGNGRVIYFFNEYFKIKYYGIEYLNDAYKNTKDLFSKNKNIKIKNEDFRNLDFLNEDNDCFFLNEPLKNKKDFEIVANGILQKHSKLDKKYYIILINVSKDELKIFSNLHLVDFEIINTRGNYIYSN